MALIIILTVISYLQNSSHLIYSLDDAYIHMAMAKNFAIHGIWGVTKYEFCTSSSSLLWTLLLALFYKVTGTSEVLPFIFNIIPAVFILVFVFSVLRKQGAAPGLIIAVLLGFIILPPLPPLMFTGLEHVLHILISLMFIYYATVLLTAGSKNLRILFLVLLLSVLLPAIRYEGLVIVISCAFLLFLQRRFLYSLLMVIFPLVPIASFGFYSISKGWSFFPNSLLLKGSLPDVYSLPDFLRFLSAVTSSFFSFKIFLLIIIVVSLVVILITIYCWTKKPSWLRSKNFNILFLLAANIFLYLVYARSGWSYRYQSFLISLCLFVFVIIYSGQAAQKIIWREYPAKSKMISLVILFFILILTYNGIKLIYQAPTASKNIYEQQYQMGQFLNRFYRDKGVALNDIGACNYFADIKCLDLWGLSNLEISKLRRTGNFTSDNIIKAAKEYNVSIAIVYDSWFAEGDSTIIPKEWIKVGQWKIKDNIIAGDDTISFYAVDETEGNILLNNLKLFSGSLPKDVIQSGKYTYLVQ